MNDTRVDTVPVSLTLSTSTPICYASGKAPFTVTTTHKCITDRPIWALRWPFPLRCDGIETRDPERNYRRVGPDSEILDGDPVYILSGEEVDRQYSILVHLVPGKEFDTSYTYSVVKKRGGLINADIWNLKHGKSYQLTLRPQRWWWMYEDDLPADSSEEQKREILSRLPETKWKPDCKSTFEFGNDRGEGSNQNMRAVNLMNGTSIDG